MSRAILGTTASRFENLGAAFIAGLEAGLAGLTLSLALPPFLWILELESLVCLIPVFGNLFVWPCAGLLAVFWLSDKGSQTRGDHVTAGLLAGVITGLASGVSCSIVTLLRLVNSQTLGALHLFSRLTPGQLLAGAFILFGVPIAIIATATTGFTALIVNHMLSAPVEDVSISGDRLKTALGKPSPSAPFSTMPYEVLPSRREITDDLMPAIAALEEGDRQQATSLLADLLRKRPRHTQAWLWLAATLDDPDRKRDCIKRALSFDPSNNDARRMLAALSGAGTPRDVAPVSARIGLLRKFLHRYVPRRANIRYLIPVAGVEIIMVCLAIYMELT